MVVSGMLASLRAGQPGNRGTVQIVSSFLNSVQVDLYARPIHFPVGFVFYSSWYCLFPSFLPISTVHMNMFLILPIRMSACIQILVQLIFT